MLESLKAFAEALLVELPLFVAILCLAKACSDFVAKRPPWRIGLEIAIGVGAAAMFFSGTFR